jgi:P27 family predicted phage terminase small subunit
MPTGRKPKPTALRLLDGDRESRINRNEPIPRGLPPQCPEDAADDVRAVWDYTVRELDHMNLAFACDRDALRAYCEAVVSHRKACQILAKSPILVRGAKGNMVRNPALAAQHAAANTLRLLAVEFGLTPSARSRIEHREADSGADDNPFAGTG